MNLRGVEQKTIIRKMTALDAYQTGKMALPDGYAIEHGVSALVLRRTDGSVVAAFSAASTPPSKVVRLAEQDFHSNRGRH
jgi:hypothetical protein